mmetsp:Transcript_14327/g.21518  ORF Transcript_14327/g.21518 Transcript_14327/m.21518 type:complete len:215 (-) Transcript_14327:355-999(-)
MSYHSCKIQGKYNCCSMQVFLQINAPYTLVQRMSYGLTECSQLILNCNIKRIHTAIFIHSTFDLALNQSIESFSPRQHIFTTAYFRSTNYSRRDNSYFPIYNVNSSLHCLNANLIVNPKWQVLRTLNKKNLAIIDIPTFNSNIRVILKQISRYTFHHCDGKRFIHRVRAISNERAQVWYCTFRRRLIILVIFTMQPESQPFSAGKPAVFVFFFV